MEKERDGIRTKMYTSLEEEIGKLVP